MRDAISFDPIDPPEGVELTDAERMLWQGRCPWCSKHAAFSPSEEFDGSWVCRGCGAEFDGPKEDRPGEPPQRAVTAVYRAGKVRDRRAAANSLPEVTERPGRGRNRSAARDPSRA